MNTTNSGKGSGYVKKSKLKLRRDIFREKTNQVDNSYKIPKLSGTIVISDSDDDINQDSNGDKVALELNVCEKRTRNRRLGRKKEYVEGNLESTDSDGKINLAKNGNKTRLESNNHQKGEYVEDNNLESTNMRRYEKGIRNTAVVIKMMNEYGLNDIYLPVEKTCRLANMKKCYAETFQIPIHSLRFFLDGQRVNDWDTPEDLEIDNGDVIEVYTDFDSQDLASQSSNKSGAVSLVGSHQSRAEALYEDMTRVIELLSSDDEETELNASDSEEEACSNIPENDKYNYVFIEIETMIASDSQSKEITQIGGFKENSADGTQARFFKAIEPKKLNFYLENYKFGGDLLQTLNIQKNESGSYEFRKPFEIVEEGRMAVQCVSEEVALEELSAYLASVENCVIFSLCEASIELLIQRIKFFQESNKKIHMDTVKGFCSWTSFLKEDGVFKEEVDQEFEEWYDGNVYSGNLNKHADAVAKMVREAIDKIGRDLGCVDEHLVKASQSIKSLMSKQVPEEFQKSDSQIEYLELCKSLRPDFPVTITLKKIETYDILENEDRDLTNVNVLNVEIEKEDVEKESSNPPLSDRMELNSVNSQDVPVCTSLSSLTSAPAQVASEITIPPTTCTICNKKFWTVLSKNLHIILVHNPNDVDQMPILPMELQCTKCYKWFCSEELKSKHVCSLQRIPLFLKCEHCQAHFGSYQEKIGHVLMCSSRSRGRRSRSRGRRSRSRGRRSRSRGRNSRSHRSHRQRCRSCIRRSRSCGHRSRSRRHRSRSRRHRTRSRGHRSSSREHRSQNSGRRSRSRERRSRSRARRSRSRERRSKSRRRRSRSREDRSRSREHRSQNSGRRSIKRERRSRSRGRRSKSRERRSKSRRRRPKSRDDRSRSRDDRSRSRENRSRSREHGSKLCPSSIQFIQEIQKLGVKFGVTIDVDGNVVGSAGGIQNYVAGLANIVTKTQNKVPQLQKNMGGQSRQSGTCSVNEPEDGRQQRLKEDRDVREVVPETSSIPTKN